MTILCRCRFCEFEFIHPGMESSDSIVTIKGASTTCTKCGKSADILDGIYITIGNELTGLTGPDLTIQVAKRLSVIATRAREGGIEATELIAEIAGVSPELAAKIRDKGLSVFGILMLLFWLIKSVQIDIRLDVNKLIDQIRVEETNKEILKYDENTPIPEKFIISKPELSTIAAGPKTASPNRKERRRQASLEKRRAKNNV